MECSEFVKIRKHAFHHFIYDVFWHIEKQGLPFTLK